MTGPLSRRSWGGTRDKPKNVCVGGYSPLDVTSILLERLSLTFTADGKRQKYSLRSWRDFVRECFCFGSEAVNASGEAVRGLVKSRIEFPPAQISGVF